ncbi:flagellar export chaperone FliS [Psychromonas sp. 14N.309.X.WAT.B.A12]|jgi:flagellar secretion chaperone FliS|uniref:flagellar export chaperone FliS n=1 Tax=unclassified Psychromonas TaxID=2614957 RepID=UPI0025B27C69|nr:flagellar export chaperone FliS [Psychromonas sp. 14N.309.X.WAT.B.A12]MDN2662883.1 flagellar export chaperone FliS [Psychromonas sp. 14N.309.X.WAT.B.A12]
MRRSLQQYKNSNMNNIEQADPHTLVSLIMQHIQGNLAGAKGAIERKEIENRNTMLTRVIGLIGELQNSLDMEKGGEISTNLYDLYAYMIRRVNQANRQNDAEPLTEVLKLITEIKSGWDGIPLDIRQQYNR